MIFISHDLSIVQFISDDILVLYKGRILEMGKKDEVFFHPLHPYTRMLIRASQGEFCAVEEKVSNFNTDESCTYYQRCEQCERLCATRMPNLEGTKDHSVACFKAANYSF
jgi:oligopeptide/dipeptide ABC transporter ATP-binding protein